MISASTEVKTVNHGKRARKLNSRLPRVGKVVFDSLTGPVHCTVREFSSDHAVLTMSGWLGLPSQFILFVEPDSVRANCRVLERRGSNIRVEFTDFVEGERLR